MEELAGDYGKSFSSLQTDYCVFMPDSFGITKIIQKNSSPIINKERNKKRNTSSWKIEKTEEEVFLVEESCNFNYDSDN